MRRAPAVALLYGAYNRRQTSAYLGMASLFFSV